jgi:hypothetical protein
MGNTVEISELFKTCSMCDAHWDSIDSFLADRSLSFNGYQANFGMLDEGIFFFTHNKEKCGSTLGIKVWAFASLFSGIKYSQSKQLSAECPRYCLDQKNLGRCSAECENAFAREISQIIKDKTARHESTDAVTPAQ